MLERIRTLDYVILLCENWEKMRGFYHEALGFPVYRESDGWCELRVGGQLLTLRPRDRPYDGAASAGAGVQLAFRVAPNELDGCWRELRAAGVEILEPPKDRDHGDGYGHRTLFFCDPERNLLEIYADIESG
jgi:catechol 2,3-dioxygenase-like lactoylglutathione lyase family enzyme